MQGLRNNGSERLSAGSAQRVLQWLMISPLRPTEARTLPGETGDDGASVLTAEGE